MSVHKDSISYIPLEVFADLFVGVEEVDVQAIIKDNIIEEQLGIQVSGFEYGLMYVKAIVDGAKAYMDENPPSEDVMDDIYNVAEMIVNGIEEIKKERGINDDDLVAITD